MMYNNATNNMLAKEAYRKFLRKRGVFGFSLTTKNLKVFKEIQGESKAFNNSYLGIKSIPLEKIVGSVEKYRDFDNNFIPKNSIIEERWCNIYKEVMGDGNLPPVNLYKIREEYFVYDGNHRISVAKFMNFKSIEAEVTEFFPSSDTEEDVILKEKFAFEKELGLEGIEVTKAGAYDKLRRSIEDYKIDNKMKGYYNDIDVIRIWYDRLYKPIRRILLDNMVVKGADGDAFLGYLDHKYYLSEYRKHNVGYAYAIIDYVNYMRVIKGMNNLGEFRIDRNFTTTFRDLYNLDKSIFYKDEFQYKLKRIGEFSKRTFTRQSHILGEIIFYMKKNNIEDYEEGLKQWFSNIYASYYEMYLNKCGVLGRDPVFDSDKGIVEDIIRYSREYRRIYGAYISESEIIMRYMVDIYLPISELLEGRKGPIEDYLDISHRYMYYVRYGGEKNLVDFEKKYVEGEGGNFLLETLNFRGNKSDIFRDIKGLIIYYASTKSSGEKQVDEFYKIVNQYGGTHNFSTIKNLKESLIQTMEQDQVVDWVEDVLRKDLEELSNNKEILINYNTKRIFKLVKGHWRRYSVIDYYASIIPLDIIRKNKSIVDVGKEYMKRDFRY